MIPCISRMLEKRIPQDGSGCPSCVETPTPNVPIVHPPKEDKPPHEHVQRYTWCLDAGHGPLTKGKRSPKTNREHKVAPDGVLIEW
ncbi:MAG: hypothetical protein AAFO91_11895, partial [Bacteroidota bacterium]